MVGVISVSLILACGVISLALGLASVGSVLGLGPPPRNAGFRFRQLQLQEGQVVLKAHVLDGEPLYLPLQDQVPNLQRSGIERNNSANRAGPILV